MPRARDEPIPPDERLYRGVDADEVNGAELLATAVDLAGMSVARHKYVPDVENLQLVGCSGLAFTTPSLLPTCFRCGELDYEAFAHDDPQDNDPAHAEVRLGRAATATQRADRPENRAPGNKNARQTAKAALARAFTVSRKPS